MDTSWEKKGGRRRPSMLVGGLAVEGEKNKGKREDARKVGEGT